MAPRRIHKRHPGEQEAGGRSGAGREGRLEQAGASSEAGREGDWEVMAAGNNECEGVG